MEKDQVLLEIVFLNNPLFSKQAQNFLGFQKSHSEEL